MSRVYNFSAGPAVQMCIRDRLFDMEKGTQERLSISDSGMEKYFRKEMVRLMKESDAPLEQYERMGLPVPIE